MNGKRVLIRRGIRSPQDIRELAKNPDGAKEAFLRLKAYPTDKEGRDPLSYSLCYLNSLEISLELSEIFAHGIDNSGVTNTMRVMAWKNPLLIEAIGGKSLNWNFRTNDGGTALMQACVVLNSLAVKACIEWGADTEIKDNSGKKAIDYVEAFETRYSELRKNKEEILEMLSNPNSIIDFEKAKLTWKVREAIYYMLNEELDKVEKYPLQVSLPAYEQALFLSTSSTGKGRNVFEVKRLLSNMLESILNKHIGKERVEKSAVFPILKALGMPITPLSVEIFANLAETGPSGAVAEEGSHA